MRQPPRKPKAIKQRTRAGRWRTFERRFGPIDNANGTPIWEREELPAGVDVHHVWTVLDCDGKLYLSPGYRFVNRLAYVRCAKPWTEDDQRQPDYRYD